MAERLGPFHIRRGRSDEPVSFPPRESAASSGRARPPRHRPAGPPSVHRPTRAGPLDGSPTGRPPRGISRGRIRMAGTAGRSSRGQCSPPGRVVGVCVEGRARAVFAHANEIEGFRGWPVQAKTAPGMHSRYAEAQSARGGVDDPDPSGSRRVLPRDGRRRHARHFKRTRRQRGAASSDTAVLHRRRPHRWLAPLVV